MSQEVTDNSTSALAAWVMVATLELALEHMQLFGRGWGERDA